MKRTLSPHTRLVYRQSEGIAQNGQGHQRYHGWLRLLFRPYLKLGDQIGQAAIGLVGIVADESGRGEPEDEGLPDRSAKFDSDRLGISDGDYPDWPEQKMLDWLPGHVCRQFGKCESSVLNGPFFSLNVQRAPEIAFSASPIREASCCLSLSNNAALYKSRQFVPSLLPCSHL